MNTSQAVFRLSLLAIGLIVLLLVPLPYYVRCPMRLAPRDAAAVYVDVPGRITEVLVRPGETVAEGQPLLRMTNLDLELAAAKLSTQCQSQSGKVSALRQLALSDDAALAELAQAEEALAALQEELQWRREQLEELVIRAPQAGVVLSAPRRSEDDAPEDQLARWHGHPLESRNLGAHLAASDLVCLVGDPTQWETVLAVDGQEVDFVRTGQRVDLLPAQRPGSRITTTVSSVSERELDHTPAAMSARSGGELLTTLDSHGRERPTFVTYEAAAQFDDASSLLASGGGGIARIHAGYQTPARRLWRELRRTFHFEL